MERSSTTCRRSALYSRKFRTDSDPNQCTTPGLLWSGPIQHSEVRLYFQQSGNIGRNSRMTHPPRSCGCQHFWRESIRERRQGIRWSNIHWVWTQLVQTIGQRETIYLWKEGTTRHQGRREAQVLRQEKQIRAASIKSKNKAAQNIQREISSLKLNCKELEENRSANEEADETQDNMGNHFGGRKRKNHKKRL